jgi:transcription initiation factor IIE alpha subunit
MPKCPKCGEYIDSLTLIITNVVEEFNFYLKANGDIEEDHLMTYYDDAESIYTCPYCGEDLFYDQAEAVEFLSQDDEEEDL